jgi:hypothetical protein
MKNDIGNISSDLSYKIQRPFQVWQSPEKNGKYARIYPISILHADLGNYWCVTSTIAAAGFGVWKLWVSALIRLPSFHDGFASTRLTVKSGSSGSRFVASWKASL